MELTKTYSDIAEYGNKYHFYHNIETGTVVCTRLYKGRTIRGVAKCDPKDKFNIETGKRLAYMRCKQKFMRKKLKHARDICVEAIKEYVKAQNTYNIALEFVNDVEMQLDALNNEIVGFEQTINN